MTNETKQFIKEKLDYAFDIAEDDLVYRQNAFFDAVRDLQNAFLDDINGTVEYKLSNIALQLDRLTNVFADYRKAENAKEQYKELLSALS